MLTKIKLILFLLTWARKLIKEYEKREALSDAQQRQLDSIDLQTFEMLKEANIARKRIGYDELRQSDRFERR